MRRWFLKKASKQGFSVSSNDTRTGVECPRDGCAGEVVYNGNYFCECGWAAPDAKLQPDEQAYMDRLLAGVNRARS